MTPQHNSSTGILRSLDYHLEGQAEQLQEATKERDTVQGLTRNLQNPKGPLPVGETRRFPEGLWPGDRGVRAGGGVGQKEQLIVSEDTPIRQAGGGFSPARGSNGAKGKGKGKSPGKGQGRSAAEASSGRGSTSRYPQEAVGSSSPRSSGFNSGQMEERGSGGSSRLGPPRIDEDPIVRGGQRQVLPQRLQHRRESFGNHHGGVRQLRQGGVDRHHRRWSASISDRQPQCDLQTSCMWPRVQSRDGSGHPNPRDRDQEAECRPNSGKGLGKKLGEGFASHPRRRTGRSERSRTTGRSKSCRRRTPRRSSQRRRKGQGEEEEEKETGQEKEEKEGGQRERDRGRKRFRRRRSPSRRERGKEGQPQGAETSLWGHRPRFQRESPAESEPQGQEMPEEKREEFKLRLRREPQHQLGYQTDHRGGFSFWGRQQGPEDSRSLPWGLDCSGASSNAQEPHPRAGHGGELDKAIAGVPELLSTSSTTKGQWTSGARVAEPLNSFGPSFEMQTSHGGGRVDPAHQGHRTGSCRSSLVGGAKTGSGGFRASDPDLLGGVGISPEGGLPGVEEQMAVLFPRRKSPEAESTWRQTQKRPERPRERKWKGQERLEERRRKERWEEEGLKIDFTEIPGVVAPEKLHIAGALASGKEALSIPGAPAPDLKDGKFRAPFHLKGDTEELKMTALVKDGQSDMQQIYERGMDEAPWDETSCPVAQDDNQHHYELGPRTMQGSGAGAPAMNSDAALLPPGGSTDPKGGGDVVMMSLREPPPREKDDALAPLTDMSLASSGSFLLQRILEVLPFRSKSTGRVMKKSLFPLPTSRDALVSLQLDLSGAELSWLISLCVSLNSLWGEDLFCDGFPNETQKSSLLYLAEQVRRFCNIDAVVPELDWSDFMKIKTVDYKGVEVHVARFFEWKNIAPALPKEIGRVPLADVCTQGCKHYVENFDLYLKPEAEWKLSRAPRVMVEDVEWGSVCKGLVAAGVCGILEEHEVHHVSGRPLLNGLFGVTKDDFTPEGTEIYRLIMNLIPLNNLCMPLGGDVATLPAWSSMSPFFLQPNQNLLISSEDVKCFFYVMSVPQGWVKYLAFNKTVPEDALPPSCQGQGRRFYLASLVLPMGFLNSVSLAQHVHRNLAQFSAERLEPEFKEQGAPEHELRKDRAFPQGNSLWRIYLDNYDLLEKVEATDMISMEGTGAPGALALRQEFEQWEVPRNVKKSVERASKAEVQGATVDGVAGVAYPREAKLVKYFSMAFDLSQRKVATQKQWQVVCGGMVYFTMFRRSLLGSLNAVWTHIESFNRTGAPRSQEVPEDCRLELLRFLGLLPLAFLDFRLPVHDQVTCSDASTSGGGICASVAPTALGNVVAEGRLRGELAETRGDQAVLVVGLFDGLGALRVAIELLGVPVLGYVSVEKQAPGRRVVESHFPGAEVYEDVKDITSRVVAQLAARYSQVSLVILGAGPPCQGVSGLNADRRGALKDERSCLFSEVPRIRDLFKHHFVWCPTYTLMESVASMDQQDKDVMSAGIGCTPVLCDAADVSWCHRPRLYWFDWEIEESEHVWLEQSSGGQPDKFVLEAAPDIRLVTRAGWVKVTPEKRFPTFTTARPRATPGRKPAGIMQCTEAELELWKADKHRFPPYQYCQVHCLVNEKNVLRVPDISERELMLGFPLHYTATCCSKGDRKGDSYADTRLTLLGNTWSVPVVACLLNGLLAPLGLVPQRTPQDIVDEMTPGVTPMVQGRLFRLPLNVGRTRTGEGGHKLAFKLSNLVSIKGEDIMLNASTAQQTKFHRLRATVPAKCWHWKIVSGWKWTQGQEHINALELRAILTTMKWRLEHQRHFRVRLLHLTDSLVCLHALSRGRSSSRKLRRTLVRINALTLAAGVHPLWGYVHTDQNPADRPSRWACRVKTKFRHAKK